MILDERDECFRWRSKCRRAARRFLPDIGLALKKIAVLRRRNEFLRRPQVIRVIRFSSSSQRDDGAVMEIVIPNRIEVVAAFAASPNQFGFLPFVFRDQNDRARTCRLAGGAANGPNNVFIRIVQDALRGVEAESIEMEFFDPVATICNEKLANRLRVWSIEID